MKQNQASRTAQYMALFRAIESYRPPDVRLFNDPFAINFLPATLERIANLSRVPFCGALLSWLIDWRWPGTRTSAIARTRFIDDALETALRDGVEQVVILGAGFDCRAYRISGIEQKRVYEVDHPATLAAKRADLQRLLRVLPSHVTFVGIDFNQQLLRDALTDAGFDMTRPTFFIWEGVTNYLTERAVDETLRFISTTATGSQLIFTYVHRAVIDNPAEFEGTENLMRLLQRESEPWTFGLDPAEVPSYLATRGYRLVEDTGSVQYRTRYLNSRRRLLKGYEFYRIALALVK